MIGVKGIAVLVSCASGVAMGSVSDIASFVDQPRTFNDRPGSSLFYSSTYSPSMGALTIRESDYGQGGFANRHIAFYGDNAANKVDFDYGDGWDMKTTLRVNAAESVDNVEAGFQFDQFGFGLFGVLTGSGEIAAFGSVMPFHSFGAGVYNVGDEVMLRMVHRPGDGEFSGVPSTMEYLYNNLTTGTGWVSSGEVEFTNLEGGIVSAFPFNVGMGAQINNPDPTLGNVDIEFYNAMIPAPASLAVLGLGGLAAARRRR
jgi:hypothetical protein